jgi:hypothetical protein
MAVLAIHAKHLSSRKKAPAIDEFLLASRGFAQDPGEDA